MIRRPGIEFSYAHNDTADVCSYIVTESSASAIVSRSVIGSTATEDDDDDDDGRPCSTVPNLMSKQSAANAAGLAAAPCGFPVAIATISGCGYPSWPMRLTVTVAPAAQCQESAAAAHPRDDVRSLTLSARCSHAAAAGRYSVFSLVDTPWWTMLKHIAVSAMPDSMYTEQNHTVAVPVTVMSSGRVVSPYPMVLSNMKQKNTQSR